jgi:hypothetical protein
MKPLICRMGAWRDDMSEKNGLMNFHTVLCSLSSSAITCILYLLSQY